MTMTTTATNNGTVQATFAGLLKAAITDDDLAGRIDSGSVQQEQRWSRPSSYPSSNSPLVPETARAAPNQASGESTG